MNIILKALLICLFVGSTFSAQDNSDLVESIIKNTKKKFAPDKRVALVKVLPHTNRLVTSGAGNPPHTCQ